MSNLVFYFSGTGNCLKIAKDLSKKLETCEIVSMAKSFDFKKQYNSIGFVYPVYFWGLPNKVIDFAKSIKLNDNKNAYFYSIASHGGSPGNAIYQMYELLFKSHGIKLNYGQEIKMFSNYVNMYNMKKEVKEITEKSNEKLIPIIESVKMKNNNRVNKLTKILGFLNTGFIKKVSLMDKDYSVNNNCTGCTICEKVCPVKNIEMANSKPVFKNHCEQCVACIQFCPQKAINYKNVTRNRRRYTHPEITYNDLYEYNRK